MAVSVYPRERIMSEGLEEVRKKRDEKSKALTLLTSQPFLLENKDHIAALHHYMDEFEFELNQRNIYIGMSKGWEFWGVLWGINYFLPIIPQQLFSACFLFTLFGYYAENITIDGFDQSRSEMEMLYNWCLKEGNNTYDTQIDNTEKLNNPAIQRLIFLLGQVCEAKFMRVWPQEILSSSTESNNMGFFKSLGIFASSMISPLTSSPKYGIDMKKVNQIKMAVDSDQLKVTSYKGFETAVSYFTKDPYAREILVQQCKKPVSWIKSFVPSPIASVMNL